MTEFTSCDDCTDYLKQSNCASCIHNSMEDFFELVPKVIDLSACIASVIDMEFCSTADSVDDDSSERLWYTSKLIAIHNNGNYLYPNGCDSKCRVRQNHWHHWRGSTCPIPEGLCVVFEFKDGSEIFDTRQYWSDSFDWSLVSGFYVTGVAEGWVLSAP